MALATAGQELPAEAAHADAQRPAPSARPDTKTGGPMTLRDHPQPRLALCDAADIDTLHAHALREPGWPARNVEPPEHPLLRQALENHRYNSLLWNEEDQARRRDAPDSAIVANKRAIDRYNQCRNDAIEAMDDLILAAVGHADGAPHGLHWVNSETAGSLIDRMSIGRLKIHHMALQAQRQDADEAHRRRCAARLAALRAQHAHMRACLEALFDGLVHGRCTYRAHRQFKMYNDPALNPYLYGAAAPAAPARDAR
ncbi:hypothetical protein CAL13_03930 [Bordetella genomosp. 9]|uniref:DUF4254 domain-containing protein n=2 Tax=Bordetella genomosp. 9 TaxID=1416803 RepID=A0A1W6YWQ6_9BORD|nr:hypothetical protein CAL13_03930 [Bordetella genomosp. 9]